MLDVVYLVAILALFALVALIAQGVEKLGPQPGAPSARTPGRGAQPPTASPAPAPERSSRSAQAPAPERGGDSA
ncbi:hypothetical protein D8Y23_04460 [Microbacterium enclense]|uniref:Uncharacterized protein n=1 Tax=Microbacterium enclense TaxID=993073 RepID=A0A3S3LYA8_9MICO|nr:hypothetical protein [Microbacterium enclense]MCT2086806.1 hypothetical protein [Microbacterium enclense]RWR21239.1 hypothetical protein D8Y23_04460 [Microbacterium enclense]